MGLFDRFRSDQGQKMTPHLAFATCLIYVMGADGEMDNEEIGHLLSVLGGAKTGNGIGVGANNQALLDQAVRIARTKPIDQFLAEATPLLTDAQRMSILLNLVDSAMSDGEAEPEEQELIGRVQAAFGIPDERFAPFFDVLMAKNDRTIFVDERHPHNAPGYRVELQVPGRG
ncbi:TerB family tellurite resistance protein [Oharaeibacter diazotrophicus]|uniref:Tellurite resistance protein TerB n=1 Tax=Oharaeibacter diazotrophicus TaxID=1920512 RepID=A0A4R6RBF1_9HYPH|nr:TerB family tellurite resistance protein [Oharaeibacter diazotrophicus]TDP83379.1 tellurite resistance protein TerB [Oharaeibacter diazotrophicus]BBE72212.1 tellurite resistance protein TerB [Pleomorphomonas sp. SM30]GLS78979.1 hypothetical protein GCM10007904_43160 [Oharaeibacter diazotrophicus]